MEEPTEVRDSSNKQEKEKNPKRNPVGNVSSLTCINFKDLAKIFKNFHSFVIYYPKPESVCFERTPFKFNLNLMSKNYYFLSSHLVSSCLS